MKSSVHNLNVIFFPLQVLLEKKLSKNKMYFNSGTLILSVIEIGILPF